jgi:hypothetical protein
MTQSGHRVRYAGISFKASPQSTTSREMPRDTKFGSFAIFAAIRRASSFVISFAAEQPGSSSK